MSRSIGGSSGYSYAASGASSDSDYDDEMEHDLQSFEIAPLFDGADLERI